MKFKRSTLKAYAWVFAIAGAVFVFASGPLMELINLYGAALPGARPLSGADASLWLALTGSMMAMITYLAVVLARDTEDDVAWNALLLSKGLSSALCVFFAVSLGNTLFLLGTLIDGPIFLHLLFLRYHGAVRATDRDAWRARFKNGMEKFYEVWFLKFNDPVHGHAFWVRYTILKTATRQVASCWWVFFDGDGSPPILGRQDLALEEVDFGQNGRVWSHRACNLSDTSADAKFTQASWDLSWQSAGAAPHYFIPRILCALGIAKSQYCAPMPLGYFDGHIDIGGRKIEVKQAFGSVGHIWGTAMADNWRWAHALLKTDDAKESVVFEVLSAQAKIGPIKTPRMTFAYLWHDGKFHATPSVRGALVSRTQAAASGWDFSADLGDVVVSGDCRPDPLQSVVLEYDDTAGKKLRCDNSKTGTLGLHMKSKKGVFLGAWESGGSAAVETVVTLAQGVD
ncbi:MAG: hypothetical protein AABZ44_07830 [Elusimicrobiota bacterium]